MRSLRDERNAALRQELDFRPTNENCGTTRVYGSHCVPVRQYRDSGLTRRQPWKHLRHGAYKKWGSAIISFCGCSFRCPFCFAAKYSYTDQSYSQIAAAHLKRPTKFIAEIDACLKEAPSLIFDPVRIAKNFGSVCSRRSRLCYVQLTGGEPMLTIEHVAKTVALISKLDDVAARYSIEQRVVWQTNGRLLGTEWETVRPLLRPLKSLSAIEVLFELSLKGTNPNEFHLLSGQDSRIFGKTVDAYWRLLEFADSSRRDQLSVVARLGTGHHEKSLTLINPQQRQEMMFLRENWHESFARVHANSAVDGRMACETMNTTRGSPRTMTDRWFPAIARMVLRRCLVDRRYPRSKYWTSLNFPLRKAAIPAIRAACRARMERQYQEDFLRKFIPMRNPAAIYCGRGEFSVRARANCPAACRYSYRWNSRSASSAARSAQASRMRVGDSTPR